MLGYAIYYAPTQGWSWLAYQHHFVRADRWFHHQKSHYADYTEAECEAFDFVLAHLAGYPHPAR